MKKKDNSGTENNQEFHPIIIANTNGYCVYLPERNIFGVGDTLEDAYNNYSHISTIKEDYIKKFGLANLPAEPYPRLKNVNIMRDLALFSSKVAFSTLIIVMVFIALLPMMRSGLKDALTRGTEGLVSAESRDPRYWALKFPTDINAKLNGMSLEDREKMLKEWNQLLIRTSPLWKPLKCN